MVSSVFLAPLRDFVGAQGAKISGEEVSIRLLLLALLRDQGQTNILHPCGPAKGKTKCIPKETKTMERSQN
jgi:hypothetical protein